MKHDLVKLPDTDSPAPMPAARNRAADIVIRTSSFLRHCSFRIHIVSIVILTFACGCKRPDRAEDGGLQPLLAAISEAGVDADQLGLLMIDGMVEELTLEDEAMELPKSLNQPDRPVKSVIVDVESNEALKKLADSIHNQGGREINFWVNIHSSAFRYANITADFTPEDRRFISTFYAINMRVFLDGNHPEFVDFNAKNLTEGWNGVYWIDEDVCIHYSTTSERSR